MFRAVSLSQFNSYSLSLREIDSVQDESSGRGEDGGYVPNVLEAVLRKRHLHMLEARRLYDMSADYHYYQSC